MPQVTIYEGDNRARLMSMALLGDRVDACVTDPPYGYESIAKRYGGEKSKNAKPGSDGLFMRATEGFMHKTWDVTQIERDPAFWKLVLDVLKPGGFCLAFSGSSTSHFQAVAMHKAGFIIHPTIPWVYSGGFPKGHCAALGIDKLERRSADAERSPEAQRWEGWRYGTQTLKPAYEPIIMAQKPISEKSVARNLLKHGVGAINVEALRIPFDPSEKAPTEEAGRFPTNAIFEGSPEVQALFPDDSQGLCAGRFFCSTQPEEEVDLDPFMFHPKATREDRGESKHPTVKPVGLIEKLIKLVTPSGGVVLDPFAGSGTTAVAALRNGLDAVLMESDTDYSNYLRHRFKI